MNKTLRRHWCKYLAFGIILTVILYIVIFCVYPTPKMKSVYSPTFSEMKKDCPKGIVTVSSGGRLGNMIWEYLSVISIARIYFFDPYIPPDIYQELLKVFEQVNAEKLSDLPDICVHELYTLDFVKMKETLKINYKSVHVPIVLERYSARYVEVLNYGLDNVREELRFKPDLVDKATKFLNHLQFKKGLDDVVYVGVHYRGGDYVEALKRNYGSKLGALPDHRFYTLAMDYFRRRYQNVIFIFVTIDMKWLDKNIINLLKNDVYVKSDIPIEQQQYEDLVLLSHCNHSIINYGTFGATAALLAGGETLAYDVGIAEDFRGFTLVNALSRELPNWHLCNNTVCDFLN